MKALRGSGYSGFAASFFSEENGAALHYPEEAVVTAIYGFLGL
jgi:hypothetical protein